MLLYHSTSIKNANSIIKTWSINSHCYLSPSLKESQYYGSMYGRYKTFVIDTDNYPSDMFIKQTYYQNTKELRCFVLLMKQ